MHRILLAAAGALLCAGGVRAQSLASAQALVTVDVVDGLLLARTRNLSFGTVGQNSGPVILPITSSGAAELRLLADRNRPVTVQIVAPAALTDGSGNSIPYTWAAGYNEGATAPGDPAASTAFPAAGTASIRPRENVGGNRRRAYLWLHGSVDVGNVPAGTYTGTVTLQAAY